MNHLIEIQTRCKKRKTLVNRHGRCVLYDHYPLEDGVGVYKANHKVKLETVRAKVTLSLYPEVVEW